MGLGSAGQILVVVYTLRGEDVRLISARHATRREIRELKAEYDFSEAKRGALLPTPGKTRITIYIDNAVLDEFRARAEQAGTGYQTMMNDALKGYLEKNEPPVTESVLRRVIREELPQNERLTKRSTRTRQKAGDS